LIANVRLSGDASPYRVAVAAEVGALGFWIGWRSGARYRKAIDVWRFGGHVESVPAAVEIGSLITRSPGICGGRPRINGTGVSVRRIVVWYKLGLSPEEIAERIGHPSLAQVHAALAFYHANRDQIEAELATEEVEADRLAAGPAGNR
jgi:uncharacterized protein (DUF433 family)